MRFYIADQHFFHNNLNTAMDKRGFPDAESMNEYMIARWNERVKKKDEVVILGDFSVGTPEQTAEILKRLAGKKFLVAGNHDRFAQSSRFDTSLFGWIHAYKEMSDNGRKVVLCHYPVMCYNGQYRVNSAGEPKTYMLYGHVHNTYDEDLIRHFVRETRESTRLVRGEDAPTHIPCQMINCFCMRSDYRPLTLDEWIALDRTEPARPGIFPKGDRSEPRGAGKTFTFDGF